MDAYVCIYSYMYDFGIRMTESQLNGKEMNSSAIMLG